MQSLKESTQQSDSDPTTIKSRMESSIEDASTLAKKLLKKLEAIQKSKNDLSNTILVDYVSRSEHEELQEQINSLKLTSEEREAQYKQELEKAAAENKSLTTLVGELHSQLKDAKAAKKHAIAKLKSVFQEIGDSDDEVCGGVVPQKEQAKETVADEDTSMTNDTLVERGQHPSKEDAGDVLTFDADQGRDGSHEVTENTLHGIVQDDSAAPCDVASEEKSANSQPERNSTRQLRERKSIPAVITDDSGLITFRNASKKHMQDAIKGRDYPSRAQYVHSFLLYQLTKTNSPSSELQRLPLEVQGVIIMEKIRYQRLLSRL